MVNVDGDAAAVSIRGPKSCVAHFEGWAARPGQEFALGSIPAPHWSTIAWEWHGGFRSGKNHLMNTCPSHDRWADDRFLRRPQTWGSCTLAFVVHLSPLIISGASPMKEHAHLSPIAA
jgi:hypothetical protein